MSNVSWGECRFGGMVVIQNQEWPPHFSSSRHDFGIAGASASQNRNRLTDYGGQILSTYLPPNSPRRRPSWVCTCRPCHQKNYIIGDILRPLHPSCLTWNGYAPAANSTKTKMSSGISVSNADARQPIVFQSNVQK